MFQREPVLVLLAGLAGVVNLVLIALVAVGALDWDPGQIAAVIAAITAICGLIAAMIRAAVVAPATDAQRSADAYTAGISGHAAP